ncbi:MAG: TRAP transporter large permease subunit, partial [Dehalococcoidales bacterium]|nr:TRAP transporter large permease subunit [Dehalococcoidales bacterium]
MNESNGQTRSQNITAAGADNMLEKVITVLDKVGIFSKWTNVVGLTAIFLLICMTFVDVILRYVFNRPMEGQTDITEVILILAVYLAITHTYNMKSHITVDLVTASLAPKSKLVLEFITTLFGLFTFIIVAWRVIARTIFDISVNSMHRMQVPIPRAPFDAIIAFGVIMLCLLLLRDILRNVVKGQSLGLTWYHRLLMAVIPIAFIVLAFFWMQPDVWQLSLPLVAVIGVAFCLVLFLTGMPVAFSLILTSILFISHIRGWDPMLSIIGTDVYQSVGSWTWAVLPFFVTMGYLCLFARFGEDLYKAASKWLGHLPGGIAISTIGACTGFAAIVGDPVSATATMGSVALPQMRKYKYDDQLSTGSVMAGATLGPIIPPSVPFILFSILTAVSVGDLFVAGIFPGLLIALLFIIYIFMRCRLNSNMGPAGERSGWKDRFISLKAIGPVLILFMVVIGGIYIGAFTPNEGGAIGAVIALVLGLIMKRFTIKSFFQTLREAGVTISMVFLILVGALLFTRFVAWCNLSGVLTNLITGMGLSPAYFTILVLIVFLILGCFIDLMPLMLIGVPIVFPISQTLGINPIWFGVLINLVINIGSITPPVGINLFVLKGL